MTLEKIVLIFALFGSAKVVFDILFDFFKRKQKKNESNAALEKALLLMENLIARNEVLARENAELHATKRRNIRDPQ